MWMMGCTGGREFEVHDAFNGRKLRPLVPRHNPSVSSSSSAHPPSFNSIHGHDFLGQLHHFTNVNDESKRQVNNSPQVVVSSRWNPTPEQLRALEELYRRGTRTPSAEQIQHITSQLRRYGKIEGKNVFYWFQNHKARERQKRRRQLESSPQSPPPDIQILKGKDTGASRAVYEDEKTKNRPPLTNCSALSEESISTQRAPKGSIFTECMAEGRIQTEKEELIHRKNLAERNSTWQLMQASSRPLSLPNQLINTSRRTSLITARNMDPNFIKTDDFNISMAPPYRENGLQLMNLMSNQEYYCQNPDQSETLELFPLCSGNGNDNDNYNYNDDNGRKEFEISTSGIDGNIGSHQFFEFLPLKN